MKNTHLLLLLIFTSYVLTAQQNITIDPAFNAGRPFVDEQYQEFSRAFPWNFRSLNDSTIIYFSRMEDYSSNMSNKVYVKTIKSNGQVENRTVEIDRFNGYPGYESDVTDVLAGHNGDFYVIQNDYQIVKVHKYYFDEDYDEVGGYLKEWTYSTVPNYRFAKAYLTSDSKVVIFSIQQFRDIARHEIAVDGTSSFTNFSWDNKGDTISKITDLLVLANGDVILVDNAYISSSGTITQLNRLIKITPNGSLVSSFGNNGIKYLTELPSFNTSWQYSNYSNIIKIHEDNGKLLLVGHDADQNSSNGRPINKGVILRLKSNGTADSSFANNGIFNPGLSNFGYETFQFNSIQKTNDNKYLAFGGGSKTSIGKIGFILSLDVANGSVNTALGNNGKMFENKNFTSIHDARIIYPNQGTANDAKIIVLGTTDSSFVFEKDNMLPTTAIARLVWTNQNSTSVQNMYNQEVLIYPNPANSVLNIELPSECKVEIYSVHGKLVMVSETEKVHTLTISSLTPGVYFIKADNITTKFIKE